MEERFKHKKQAKEMTEKNDTRMVKFLNNHRNELLSEIGLLFRGDL